MRIKITHASNKHHSRKHCTKVIPRTTSFVSISCTFNSLFKGLFKFPSQYLFAIGLYVLFSFTWSLPGDLCWSPDQHDSWSRARTCQINGKDGTFTLCGPDFHQNYSFFNTAHLSEITMRLRNRKRFSFWAFPSSVALTNGIIVIFFSSA